MKILYIGDGPSDGAARYLISVMRKAGIDYVHFPPSKAGSVPSESKELKKYDSIILSDVPSRLLGNARMASIRDYVRSGGGLGMIGGWESFTGSGGGYRNTPIEEALPVRCAASDDRVNNSNGFKMIKKLGHPILSGLPWGSSPTVCGFNRVTPKKGSITLLSLKEIMPNGRDSVEGVRLSSKEHPLLVVGSYKAGRTLALTTDVAPHWVGGMVDWGKRRIKVGNCEVGDKYIQFLQNILNWLCKF